MFDWLYTAISWVLKMWHSLFSTFLDPAAGLTWALSIVFLVITVRILLFRLFVKQVRSQRAMQELQPEIAKLKKQYGSDRQGMAQAMSALQKERGVNPLAGCLPILPQIPVFIGLLHVLRRLRPDAPGLYGWNDTLTDQAASAQVFGAPISSAFFMPGGIKTDSILDLPGVELTTIRVVTTVLIVVMCLTTFFTQKQIMSRSGPVEGQAAMIQKLLLYGMPIGLFVSSFFFPLGVLMYCFVNNLWTLGQHFYILKKLPPPGSAGAKAKAEAERPKIDPKELAPKPGAKPVRGPKGRTPVINAATAAEFDSTDEDAPAKPAVAGPGAKRSGGSKSARPLAKPLGKPMAKPLAQPLPKGSAKGAKATGKGSGTSGTARSPNGTAPAAGSGRTPPGASQADGNGSPAAGKPKAQAGSGARPTNRPAANKNRRKKR
ncbi:MAG: membrane protein insertase YidC [Actinomycetota bacterium]|nr:membrane protein insertase YidC [Actinomycetota bacterium]